MHILNLSSPWKGRWKIIIDEVVIDDCALSISLEPFNRSIPSWAFAEQVKELEKLHLFINPLPCDIHRRAKQLRAIDCESRDS